MKLKLFLILLCTFSNLVISKAQSYVGINTTNPLETLDVNGNVVLRGPLRIGGDDNTLGDPGGAFIEKTNEAYLLRSGGASASSKWSKDEVPVVGDNEYYLSGTYLSADSEGVILPSPAVGDILGIKKNETFNSSWTLLPQFNLTIRPPEVRLLEGDERVPNKLFFNLQLNTSTVATDLVKGKTVIAIVAVGIFLDEVLVASGITSIAKYSREYPYVPFTIRYLQNIGEGPFDVKVGAKILQVTDKSIQITASGPSVGEVNNNNFMMQSSLAIDVLSLNP